MSRNRTLIINGLIIVVGLVVIYALNPTGADGYVFTLVVALALLGGWAIVMNRAPRLQARISQITALVLFGAVILYGLYLLVEWLFVGSELPAWFVVIFLVPFLLMVGGFLGVYVWGSLLMRLGRFDIAEAHYTNLIQLGLGFAYSERALARSQLGRLDDALTDYQTALEIAQRAAANPQNPSQTVRVTYNLALIYFNRSALHLRRRDYPAALADVSAGLAIIHDRQMGQAAVQRPPQPAQTAQDEADFALLSLNGAIARLCMADYPAALTDITQAKDRLTGALAGAGFGAVMDFFHALIALALDDPDTARALWQAVRSRDARYAQRDWLTHEFSHLPPQVWSLIDTLTADGR